MSSWSLTTSNCLICTTRFVSLCFVCVSVPLSCHIILVFLCQVSMLHFALLHTSIFLNISFRLPLLLCVILLCTHSLQKLIISPLSFSSKSSKDSWIPWHDAFWTLYSHTHTHRHTQAHELYVNGVFADSHAAVRGLAIKFCALIYLRNMSSLKKWVPFWTPFCTHYSEPGFYSGKLPQIHQYELYLNKFV